MTFDDYVRPICPPATKSDEWMSEGEPIHVCGWGNTQVVGENYPAKLHCVDTKYVKKSICNERRHYNGEIRKGMFCAGEVNEGGKERLT